MVEKCLEDIGGVKDNIKMVLDETINIGVGWAATDFILVTYKQLATKIIRSCPVSVTAANE